MGGNPGRPNGGAGKPCFKGPAPAAPGALPGPAPLGVLGFGVVGLSSGFEACFLGGAGVDEAEDRPDLGLTGSFLACSLLLLLLPLPLPFSLGGVRRESPF